MRLRCRESIVICILCFSTAVVAAGGGGERTWNFENGADGWDADTKECGVVPEPGAAANHVYQIVATRPHHTRIMLQGSEKTPDFMLRARFRVLESTGQAPNIYLYGRVGGSGFRGASLAPTGGRATCYFGVEQPAVSLGTLPATDGKNWTRAAIACVGDYVFAKVWPDGSPEPTWQAEGKCEGHPSGKAAVCVWTSPKIPSTARVIFDDVRFTPLTRDVLEKWGAQTKPRPALDVAPLAGEIGVFRAPGRVGLASKRAALAFDEKTGEITNFVDVATRREFVARDAGRPLFGFTLTKPYENKRADQSSKNFAKAAVRETGPKSLVIDFDGLPDLPIAASVTAALLDDEQIGLRIQIRNKSDWCVAGVVFPQATWAAALGNDGADYWLLVPFGGGAVIPEPGKRRMSKDAAYPGQSFAQFYALYDGAAGLYCALDDASGQCKEFRLKCGNGVAMDVEHSFPELPGRDAQISYSVVLRTFKGDWRDAADIYKTWALKQPWTQKRLAEREDVAQFLKEGSAVIVSGVGRGQQVIDRFGTGGEKLLELLNAYRDRTGMKHIVFVPYGWENRGTWAGINYLPCNPSNEYWQKAGALLKENGHRMAFLLSGYWWVVKRQETHNGPAFDDTADFERRRGMCATRPDGSSWLVDEYGNTKDRMNWRGLSAMLCHGSPDAARALKESFLGAAKMGVPLLSFDQEIGGQQKSPCYNRTHGHPPGYGDWMWTGFRDLCADILKEGRPIQPELGLLMENDSELAIPVMATYWSRQFGEVEFGAPGGRGVGLFSYLYHEYVTAIGAACVQGQGEAATRPDALLRCRILANNLTRGLIPGPFVQDVPLDPGKDEWKKTVSAAFFSYCQPYARFPEYLLLGKTRHPVGIECENVETWYWVKDAANGKPTKPGGPPLSKRTVTLPAITTGSFEAPDGSVAAFVVNTTSQTRQCVALLPKGGPAVVYRSDRKEDKQIPASEGDRRVSLSLEPFGVRAIVVK